MTKSQTKIACKKDSSFSASACIQCQMEGSAPTGAAEEKKVCSEQMNFPKEREIDIQWKKVGGDRQDHRAFSSLTLLTPGAGSRHQG